MGPQSLAAQLFRPIELDRAPVAELFTREASSRFQSYLDASRPAATRRNHASGDIDRNQDAPEPDVADDSSEPDAVDAADAPADESPAVVIESPLPLVVAPDVQSRAMTQADAPIEQSAAADAPQRPAGPAIPQTTAQPQHGDHHPGAPAVPQSASGGHDDALRSTADMLAPQVQKAQQSPGQPTASALAETAPTYPAEGRQSVVSDAQPQPPVVERPPGPARPGKSAPAPSLPDQRPERVDKAVQAPSQPIEPQREASPRLNAVAETVFERKVRLSNEQRREGSSNASTDGRQDEKTASPARAGGAERGIFTPRADGTALLPSLKSATLRTGQGDSAAAAIARFLLVGSGSPESLTLARDVFGGTPSSATTPPASAGASSAFSSSMSHGAGAGLGGTPIAELLVSNAAGTEQIDAAARVLSASGAGGRFNVTMQLEPPDLGMLRVQVRMSQQGMTLNVNTQSAAVARLVESRLSELRDALATHGIRIDRADVVVKAPDPGAAGGQANLHQQSGQEAGADGRPAQYPTNPNHGHTADSGGMASRDDHHSDQSDRAITAPSAEDLDSPYLVGDLLTNAAPSSRLIVDLVA